MAVKTFSIGFGREIFGFTDRKGTRWRFAWIPLGGYVKFLDDENAASQPSKEALARMSPAERAGAFQTKPIWQRAAVVAAGPMANFILAIAIYTAVNLTVGVRTIAPRVGEVMPDMPAAAAGFKPGDVITSIDGWGIEGFEDIQRIVGVNGGRKLVVGIERDGKKMDLAVTPKVEQQAGHLRRHVPPRSHRDNALALARGRGGEKGRARRKRCVWACAKPTPTSRRRCRVSGTSSRGGKQPIKWAAPS